MFSLIPLISIQFARLYGVKVLLRYLNSLQSFQKLFQVCQLTEFNLVLVYNVLKTEVPLFIRKLQKDYDLNILIHIQVLVDWSDHYL
jgi:hypothetical protein